MHYSDSELRAGLCSWLPGWPTDVIDIVLRLSNPCPNGDFVHKWGEVGRKSGEFIYPAACAIDGQGQIYVIEHHGHRVQVFSSEERKCVNAWGKMGIS